MIFFLKTVFFYKQSYKNRSQIVQKLLFSKTIVIGFLKVQNEWVVIRFLKVQNEWVVFKNDRFRKRLKNETKNDRFQKRLTTLAVCWNLHNSLKIVSTFITGL